VISTIDELFEPLPKDYNLRVVVKWYYMGLLISNLIEDDKIYPGFNNEVVAHYNDFLTKLIKRFHCDGMSKEEIKTHLCIDDETYDKALAE
jgi:hypothetical protein